MYSIQSEFLSTESRNTLFSQHTFDNERLMNILKELLETAQSNNMTVSATELNALLYKLQEKRRTALFCGHFSAGKSTVLNQLTGEDVLPFHPIPTSANVVHIQKGDSPVLMYHDTNTGAKQTLTHWSSHSFTDKSVAEEVYIELPLKHFPDRLEVIDTPGIDSTDHAHRLAAESRLLEADSVLYIVDYQQVETQENFSFLQQVNDLFIKPILIVNQMDKHNNKELSFAAYQSKIEKSIKQHDINLKDILYISAIDPSKSYDQGWEKLFSELFAPSAPEDTVYQTVARGTYKELESIAMNIQESFIPPTHIQKQINAYTSLESLKNEHTNYDDMISEIPRWKGQIEKDLLSAFDRVFKNAKLTPYHTRNLIRDYLESRQPGFRLKGILSFRRKTSFEKEHRQERLLKSLNENIRNYIDIHLKNEIDNIFTKYQLHSRSLLQHVISIRHEVVPETLKAAERKGALFSQEYVLTYSRLIIDEVRKKYKESLVELFPDIQKEMAVVEERELERLEQHITTSQQLIHTWETREDQYSHLQSYVRRIINRIIDSKQAISPTSTQSQASLSVLPNKNKSVTDEKSKINLHSFYRFYNWKKAQPFTWMKEKNKAELKASHTLMKQVDGLLNIKSSLAQRIDRLDKKTYKIALFGAFSAGKSTLANALLGEKILPVSANPTTASIHYIKAPDEQHPHQTFVVTYKSAADILQDMNDLLQPAGITLTTIEEWQELIDPTEQENKNEEEKELFDPLSVLKEEEILLLNQYHKAYYANLPTLGMVDRIDLSAYYDITSNEDKAILIKEITIYYDCSFTREGYLLTDTPGAGSIYRRHSEAAYKEMKEADTILFVSYYNHSFSKADKEFLLQLGRTKDYFSYDKMMFLINACDLAKDEQEVTEVLQYVEKELRHFGIYEPRVFPVSGKRAFGVEDMVTKETRIHAGISGFSHVFQQYANEVLEDMVVIEARDEIKQAIRLLEDRVWTMQLEADNRRKIYEERKRELEDFSRYIQSFPFELELKRIKQELEELLFYAKQRVFYRYYDEFKVIFTITRMTEEGFKAQLYRYTNEMIHFIFHELSQEIRATIIRIEHFINKQWKQIQDHLVEHLSDPLREEFVKQDDLPFPVITVQEEIPLKSDSLPFLQQFTSYNAFFAGQENKQFKEKLEESLRPYGDHYVRTYHQQLEERFEGFLSKQWQELVTSYEKNVRALQRKYNTTSSTDARPTIESVIQKLKKNTE